MPGYLALAYTAVAALVLNSMLRTLMEEDLSSPMVRALAAFSASTAIWNLAYALMHISTDPRQVMAFYRFGAFGWVLNPSFCLYYGAVLYQSYTRRKLSRWVAGAVFLPAPVFLYGVFTGRLMAVGFEPSPYGWIERFDTSSPWNLWFALFMVAGFAAFMYLTLRTFWMADTRRSKLHLTIVFIPASLILMGILILHILLPLFRLEAFPPVVHIAIGIWLVAISTVLGHFPTLSPSPRIAAEVIVAAMSDLCYFVTLDGEIRSANPAAVEFAASRKTSVVGRPVSEVFPEEVASVLGLGQGRRAFEGQRGRTLKVNLPQANGTELPFLLSVNPIQDTLRDALGWVIIAHEIREMELLRQLSETDELTGLFNRRRMEHILSDALLAQRRYGTVFSVIMADLDHFKDINDRYGHDVGDKALVEVSRVLSGCVRANDACARWGGEEFVLFCANARGPEARILAERARAAVSAMRFPEGYTLSASFGIAESQSGDTSETLVKRADQALYRAKEEGRNRTVIFDAFKEGL